MISIELDKHLRHGHGKKAKLHAQLNLHSRYGRQNSLADFRNKRTPLNKEEYITRMKGVMRSHKAQIVAKSYAARFRKTCKQVVERDGAAADN